MKVRMSVDDQSKGLLMVDWARTLDESLSCIVCQYMINVYRECIYAPRPLSEFVSSRYHCFCEKNHCDTFSKSVKQNQAANSQCEYCFR